VAGRQPRVELEMSELSLQSSRLLELETYLTQVIGLPGQYAKPYADGLCEGGVDSVELFDDLPMQELIDDYGFKKGYALKVQKSQKVRCVGQFGVAGGGCGAAAGRSPSVRLQGIIRDEPEPADERVTPQLPDGSTVELRDRLEDIPGCGASGTDRKVVMIRRNGARDEVADKSLAAETSVHAGRTMVERVPPVTICCISDTHGDHAAFGQTALMPEADVLLHAGDFTNFGREGDAKAFDAWGASQTQPRECRIVVLGNHENRWVQGGEMDALRALLPSWTVLHDEMHQAAGLTFYGMRFLAEHESERQAVQVPSGVDVLVTHNPPHGSLDGGGSGHVALRRAAEAARPKLHVFGHIHGAAGTKRVEWRGDGGTLLVNAASCLVRKISHPPIVVDVTPGPSGLANELGQGARGDVYCPLAPKRSPPSLQIPASGRGHSLPPSRKESCLTFTFDGKSEPEPQPQPQPEPEPEFEPHEQVTAVCAVVNTNSARPMCGRFRQLKLCGCTIPCRVAMAEATIDEIRPGLYIGPVQAAYSWDKLTARGITSVVDLCGSTYDRNPAQEYLCINVDDDPGADIIPAVREALPFIDTCIARGDGVLVHCRAGKSRSATVCAAWLMAREGLGAEAAIAAVKARHARTDPNHGFREALQDAACEGSVTAWLKC